MLAVKDMFVGYIRRFLGGQQMDDELILKNRLKEARSEKKLSQNQLAEMVGVSRNTISSIETGQFNPNSKTGTDLMYCTGQEIRGIILFLREKCYVMYFTAGG